jgi:IMP dehydrogenase
MGTKDSFFEQMAQLGLALTYDDVRLKTGYAEIMPDLVDTQSKFSKNVPLKIPIVSAAMDTVTEHELAIAIAKEGGLGIIHRNLTPEKQAKQVAKVKNHLHGLIQKPICAYEDETIQEILDKSEKKRIQVPHIPSNQPKRRNRRHTNRKRL